MDNPAAQQPDISQMSDEEIMAMVTPPSVEATSSGSQETQTEQSTSTEQTGNENTNTEETTSTSTEEGNKNGQGTQSTENSEQNTGEGDANSATVGDNKVDNTDPNAATSGKETQTTTEQTQNQKDNKPAEEAIDYVAFHAAIVKPFKANGKMVAPKNAEEAIQLMQMGANYTRKMQDLAPYRKAGMMLENNGLLDEGKLSYLIDLHNKNPEAIKKLIEESGYDVMAHDPDQKSTYQPNGNHTVTDSQVALKSALEDVSSTDEGRQTLQEINTQWDQASKEILFANPDILQTIHAQRESGIYQRIADEIAHQRTLGKISASVPFLQAYKAIGDMMQAQGAFAPVAKQQETAKPAPVAVRAEKPKPQVDNSSQVAAAATTRTTGAKTKTTRNPLELSDDEFMKQFEHR